LSGKERNNRKVSEKKGKNTGEFVAQEKGVLKPVSGVR
jgi:hypothetical protein